MLQSAGYGSQKTEGGVVVDGQWTDECGVGDVEGKGGVGAIELRRCGAGYL